MPESIDDFLRSFPELSGYREAERIYSKAEDPANFPKVEFDGHYELMRSGFKMAYVIGRGKIKEEDEEADFLFYVPTFVMESFFEPVRDNHDVKRIPFKEIHEIRRLQSQNTYSRSSETD